MTCHASSWRIPAPLHPLCDAAQGAGAGASFPIHDRQHCRSARGRSADCTARATTLGAIQLLGAYARQRRGRLRRYRHQPALRAARGGAGRRRSGWHGDARRRARRALADPVGADHHRHAQIRPAPAARRQQRRGRHAHADGARLARARQDHGRGDAARHHQRLAVLRRCGDHAGAVGAVRDRRPQGRDAGLRCLHRAADGGDPGRSVRGAVAWHRAGRDLLRPDHGGVVHRDRLAGSDAHRRRSRHSARDQPRSTAPHSCCITAPSAW